MLFEMHTVLSGFVSPPGRHDVEREAAAATDVIDVGGLLGQQRRLMKRGTDRDHQFQPAGDGCEGGRGRPGVERWRFDSFDVVEIQFGDQRQVVSDFFAAPGETAIVFPRRLHLFVIDVS